MENIFQGVRLEVFKTIQTGVSQFNRIKEILSLQSNELSYHLKKLREQNLIEKHEDGYRLTQEGINIYPYLSIFTHEKKPVFTVTSVALLDGENIYLQKKPREPDRGSLIFFGSKAIANLTVEESAVYFVKQQAKCDVENLKLKSINEYIKRNEEGEIIHHWVVYFYTANPVGKPKGIKKKLKDVDKMNLYGENKHFIKNSLNNRTVKATKTEF